MWGAYYIISNQINKIRNNPQTAISNYFWPKILVGITKLLIDKQNGIYNTLIRALYRIVIYRLYK